MLKRLPRGMRVAKWSCLSKTSYSLWWFELLDGEGKDLFVSSGWAMPAVAPIIAAEVSATKGRVAAMKPESEGEKEEESEQESEGSEVHLVEESDNDEAKGSKSRQSFQICILLNVKA